MNRRHALSALAGVPLVSSAWAQGEQASRPVSQPSATEIFQEIVEWRDDPANSTFFEHDGAGGRGTLVLAPEDPRVKQAAALLAGVPTTGRPIDIAKFIISRLPNNATLEWPRDTRSESKPANPIVIAFFAATRHQPYDGDQTAWCSAFMCWTLQRRGLPQPRHSGSRAFRSWFEATTDPKPGDIAVFYNSKDSMRGHVGFFDGWVGAGQDRMMLVGGNQADRVGRHEWGRSHGDLRLHSFRTHPALR